MKALPKIDFGLLTEDYREFMPELLMSEGIDTTKDDADQVL